MTDRDDLKALAGEYVLGTLDESERRAFEDLLAQDPDARRVVESWKSQLDPLMSDAEEVAPPPSVWAGIRAAVSGGDPKAARDAEAGGFTIRADEGEWTEVSPGVSMKLLHIEPDTGMRQVLMRMEPGARYRGHGHTADEVCMVLSGDVTFGGTLTLRAGDYHLAREGHAHPDATSEEGALVYVRIRVA